MSDIPARLQREVVHRAEERCEYCGLSQRGQEAAFHFDHDSRCRVAHMSAQAALLRQTADKRPKSNSLHLTADDNARGLHLAGRFFLSK